MHCLTTIITMVLLAVGCIRSKATQFAKTLHRSMKGGGTDDDTLMRTIISRCEVDMVQIKEQFQKLYNGSLGEWIKV